MPDTKLLNELQRKVLWLATWMIHNANHLRANDDGLKVGGHQASSASLVSIMTALYFQALRPQDRVAVKPHASPVFHAIQYLLGNQTRERLEAFRAFSGAQSYPSRTKDQADVDVSTGSVGLGAAITIFASLIQDYVRAQGLAGQDGLPEGRMVALVGDAELDEGNIYEALLEGWKQKLRNCWWIIDYNRQSLDAVVHEGLWERIQGVFTSFGWDVVVLKYGRLLESAFVEPGGAALRDWIDRCPNQLYAALTFQGGSAWRRRLLNDLGDQGPLAQLLERRSDEDLARLMTDLAGHCLETLVAAFGRAAAHDRPVCFLAYTIKGWGLPLAGHKDNHAGLMTVAQTEALRHQHRIRPGHEWDLFEGLEATPAALEQALAAVPFNQRGPRVLSAPALPVPAMLVVRPSGPISTQAAFGQLLNELAKGDSALAAHLVTTSPDVTVSTNLGPWVNRRGLFARAEQGDTFKDERIASTQKWSFGPRGQHIELGIAEMNLFLLLAAAGLAAPLFGARLLPVGTLYDPFIARGLDALNYACYQDARFLLVATPSGITLAPEGGAHQSIGAPLIGLSQPGLTSYEPAFADELAQLMGYAFRHMQEAEGGSVYLRLTTRPLEQPSRSLGQDEVSAMIDGAYWLRPPGPNPDIVVAYQGAVAPEAIEAVGLMAEDRRDVGLLAVTSADRLHAGWTAAQRAREQGLVHSRAPVERLLAGLPPHCGLVTLCDAHPATLGWLGAVGGHRVRALGVERFGQSGTIADLYRHHGLDAQAILRAAEALVPGRPVRYLARVG